jgi:hypothetical protein
VEKEPELDALFDPESFQITATTGYLILKIIIYFILRKEKKRKQSQGRCKFFSKPEQPEVTNIWDITAQHWSGCDS